MAEQKIELRKIRDLGENLNDTFSFIRQNFKPLVTSFLGIAGIIMLANAILAGLYQIQPEGNVFRDMLGARNTLRNLFRLMGPAYFALVMLGWLNHVAMTAVIVCYMKLYDLSQGQSPTIQQVWEEFKKYFLKVFFYSIPVALITMAGFVFCLFPGIYLAVVFAPFSIAVIVEDQTFSGAWDRCFTLIKNNFWPSLGIYAVVYLIYGVCAGLLSAFIAVLTGFVSQFTAENISSAVRIATSVLSVVSFVFYIIFYVSVCLHYFNLAERNDGEGMRRRLDTLGGSGNDFNNIQEQY